MLELIKKNIQIRLLVISTYRTFVPAGWPVAGLRREGVVDQYFFFTEDTEEKSSSLTAHTTPSTNCTLIILFLFVFFCFVQTFQARHIYCMYVLPRGDFYLLLQVQFAFSF